MSYQDIGMKFEMEKCAMLVNNKGKREMTEGITNKESREAPWRND